jgi:hypothetical protein
MTPICQGGAFSIISDRYAIMCKIHEEKLSVNVMEEGNFTLKQTVKAQRESKSVARRLTGWVVIASPQPPYSRERELVSIVQEVR